MHGLIGYCNYQNADGKQWQQKTPSEEGAQVFDLGGRTITAFGDQGYLPVGETGTRFEYTIRKSCAN